MGKRTDRMALAFLLVFLLALLMRFYMLDERVMHHDEGVFAISFVKPIYDSGEYSYNPKSTYHGPFLYYMEALGFRLFGVNEFGLRFFGALFGSLLIPLLFALRKHVGNIAAISSSLFVAVSPSMVYYSRFASAHETFLVFFELAAIASFFLFWHNNDKKYLYAGFASLGFLLTTKETSIAIAGLLVLFLPAIMLSKTKKTYRDSLKKNTAHATAFLAGYRKEIFAGVLIAFAIIAVFYTSFFRHTENLIPAIRDTVPYVLFTSEASTGHHKPFGYFTELLMQYEMPMLIFALAGLLFFRKSPYSKLSAYLLLSTWLIFSVVAYKTPWNIVHIMLPLALVAGIGAQELHKRAGKYAVLIIGAAIVYTAWLSYGANYIDHSGQYNQLAYVTTTPELMEMVGRIYAYGKDADIKLVSGDYWPLPWYLRDYRRVGYSARIADNPDGDVVIIKQEEREQLRGNLTGAYESSDYQLRYGVWLSAFYRVQ